MPHIINKIQSLCFLLCVAFSFLVQAQSVTINSGWQFSEDNATMENS